MFLSFPNLVLSTGASYPKSPISSAHCAPPTTPTVLGAEIQTEMRRHPALKSSSAASERIDVVIPSTRMHAHRLTHSYTNIHTIRVTASFLFQTQTCLKVKGDVKNT